ncbi:MAG: hypothetical protein AB7P22_05220 [Vicinamibacterales bacterium]
MMRGKWILNVGVALAAAGGVGQASLLAQDLPDGAVRAERYQVGTMERVLENAVEHGASVTRDRLRAVIPAEMLLSESAEVRGFRLPGYGVFFDVVVPNLEGMLPWVFRTLDQTDLGLESALQALRTMVERAGDTNLQQALRRIELQVAPYGAQAVSATATGTGRPAPAAAAGAAPAGTTPPAGDPTADPILNNPEEGYRLAVTEALMDAMLDHSRGLELGPGDTLTVGARRSENPRLGPADDPARTVQISMKGSDLQAYLAGSITREDARRRMDVRVF